MTTNPPMTTTTAEVSDAAATPETPQITKVTVDLTDSEPFDLPVEFAAVDDETIRKILAPHYPDATNAAIKREVKDGVLTIKVVKRAGPKGEATAAAQVIATLDAAERHVNPAVVMCLRLEGLGEPPNVEMLLMMGADIEAAVAVGRAEAESVSAALAALNEAAGAPATAVPVGF